MPDVIHAVFVSSTYEDLREERSEIQKALLKLNCFPIGMELFGSANEETWQFIQNKIDECDYFVLIIADRYGSLTIDGISSTEKEYNYARSIGKPIISFVHGAPGKIAREYTEQDPERRLKLSAFISKIEKFPVERYTALHELASLVTISFVNLRARHPQAGWVLTDQTADPLKYAKLLEENLKLKDKINEIYSSKPKLFEKFSEHVSIRYKIRDKDKEDRVGQGAGHQYLPEEGAHTCNAGDLFIILARSVITGHPTISRIRQAIEDSIEKNAVTVYYEDIESIILRFAGWRLIDTITNQHQGNNHLFGYSTYISVILTDFGLTQFGMLVD